mgnify:CR=1 FL=1
MNIIKLNRTPNHAVGEVYKPHAKLNLHDPENRYAWKEEKLPAWVWVARGLGALGFFVGIYMLTLLTFLF